MLDVKELMGKMLDALKADYVVEDGKSGVWTYRKWDSGLVELWGRTEGNVPQGWSGAGIVVQFPFTLTSYTSWSVSQANYQIARCYLNITVEKISIQTYSDNAMNAGFAFEVKGRWK